MESTDFQIKTKWCRDIGYEVDFREVFYISEAKKLCECLHAQECRQAFCRWKNGSHNDPLVNIEDELEM